MNSAPPAPEKAVASSEQPDRFKVGTLSYTKAGMITVFLFLLWGDFCFTLMETVVPTLMPLKFNSIGAPNWVLGLVMSTIPNIMTAGINPLISIRSDRFRSKWGRRIPFLAGATPFLVLFLILLGCADGIGAWVHGSILGGRFSETTVLIFVIGVFMVCFQFFNLFITSVYYYLFNDVVPQAYLARFMALFRVVGSLAGVGYNFFVLKFAKTHMEEIFIGAALLYFVAFVMMCWKVKEGNYPPPPAFEGTNPGFRAALRSYAVECFSHRFYWLFFLANSCVAMTWASGSYMLIYQTQYLGLSLDFVGKVGGVCGIISMVLLYPAGILSDRIRPIRVLLMATALQALIGPLIITFAMMRPSFTLDTVMLVSVCLSAITLPINTLYYAAELPTLMTLFPKSRYGQFCSANALVRSIALIIGGVACGAFLDFTKTLNPDPNYCYRFLPVWNFAFQAASAILLFFLYREWKKLGGKDHFKPPVNAAAAV
ncbi:MAG TPA: MFS transporter [Rariglobus sp.]|nr:MFS transporter [Rariglobus sp.]